MYRLLADVLNDIAFVLDCLSPALPKAIRVVVLSFSSVLRALCGVAAGSAKASLSAHFARWGNLGELNAKDSSQETVISLLGMLAGSLVVSWVTTPIATWTMLILLLSIHLETNRRAVRAVSMRTLNRQRATLVYHHLCKGYIPTPEQVSQQERIFERNGVLRGPKDQVLGYCTIGASMSSWMRYGAVQHGTTKSSQIASYLLPRILSLYRDESYIMWNDQGEAPHLFAVIKKSASCVDLLGAWWQALALVTASDLTEGKALDGERNLELLRKAKESARQMTRDYEQALVEAGWNLDTSALETSSSVRVNIET